ncbi:MAG: arginine--tRNA ligase [Kiritimatiellae bacterium]|jgi:arginyl-tRNA synthetase|nr:arginine--tRNA ligase [Kiritimatiellia bacterium]
MLLKDLLNGWMQKSFLTAYPELDVSGVLVFATSNAEFGDYQCNNAMALAKELRKAPRMISQGVVDVIELPDYVEKVEVAGPGFINIYVKTDWLSDYILDISKDEKFKTPQLGEGKTVILDYSSPNVAKPMHIGHIRSTIIGNALDRLHRFVGYDVIADNHIGDWGTQFGIIIMGYKNFLDEKALEENPIEELERLYVKSYGKTKDDEEWLNQCRAELVKLQNGDEENLAMWKKFVALSLSEFDRVYKRLDIEFDQMRGESYYNPMLKDVLGLMDEKGITSISEGATVVEFPEEEKLPLCIVRKTDGASNYATTDIATVKTRVEEFHPEKIIYVTDERQQLHFKQFFRICEMIGIEADLVHVWFGLMRLPEATFSTREGNVIKLEKLLDEAESRTYDIVKTNSSMSEEAMREVAKVVGIGAVKYADLSQNPQSLVTFTWEKALALDGNSGPYLQYAYARIASVLDKYAEAYPENNLDDFELNLESPVERALAMKLARFSDAVCLATATYKPNVIADYIYELSQMYSTFYQTLPFLKAEDGVRESRLKLCRIVASVLKAGLKLLGIGTLDRI